MVLLLVLIIAAFVLIAIYAAQNPGVQDVAFLGLQFGQVPHWLPVAAGAGLMTLLFLVYLAYNGALTGIRQGNLRRRVGSHEATIKDLSRDNLALQEENARLKASLDRPESGLVAPGASAPFREDAGSRSSQ